MRNFILLFFMLFIIKSNAQNNDTTKYSRYLTYGVRYNRMLMDSNLIIPRGGDTLSKIEGSIKYINGRIYYADGSRWRGFRSTGDTYLTSFSSGNFSPLFTTSVSNSTTEPSLSFSPIDANAYTLFGRDSVVGAPSFLTSIDSNWIPSLHSEDYYNTKYLGGITVPTWQQTLISGSQMTQDNTIDFNQKELVFDSIKSYIVLNPTTSGGPGYNNFLMTNGSLMQFQARNDTYGADALLQYISMANNDSSLYIGVIGGENNESVQMRVDRNGFNLTQGRIRNTDERPNFAINQHLNQSSAEFEVNSDTRGALLPRLTLSQRNDIASPATSLIIYQTDNTPGYYYYDGSAWIRFSTGVSGTVTSVGLTLPTGFSVTNSPITSSGNINVTTSLNGYLKGDGSGFSAVSSLPAADLSGTIDDARLSTNIATLTGTQTLTNKTISASNNTISGITNSSLSGSAGITNANLANSTISGVALGSNLNDLTASSGIAYTSGTTYNGSASRALRLNYSGLTTTPIDGPDELAFSDVSASANIAKTTVKEINRAYVNNYRRKLGYQYFNDFVNQITIASAGNDVQATNSGTGANNAMNVGRANEPGVLQFATGTTATGRAAISSSGSAVLLGGGTWTMETTVDINTLSTSTERYQLLIGFFDTYTAANQTDGAYLLYDEGGVSTGSTASANWQLVTTSNSTRTFTTSTTAVTTGNIPVRIVVNAAANSVEYFVNNISVGTSTTNIPSSANRQTGFGMMIIKSVGTTSRTFTSDYLLVDCDFTNPR